MTSQHPTPAAASRQLGPKRRLEQSIPAKWTQRDQARLDAGRTAAGSEECWPWTGYKDGHGYGQINWKRWPFAVHRLVCVLHHGLPPDQSMEACHRCNTPPCINPSHLYWGTRKQNVADARKAGTITRGSRMWSAKLKEEDAAFIYSSTIPAKQAATMFKVSLSLIYYIRRNDIWKHVHLV
jgi:hypothetical protein